MKHISGQNCQIDSENAHKFSFTFATMFATVFLVQSPSPWFLSQTFLSLTKTMKSPVTSSVGSPENLSPRLSFSSSSFSILYLG